MFSLSRKWGTFPCLFKTRKNSRCCKYCRKDYGICSIPLIYIVFICIVSALIDVVGFQMQTYSSRDSSNFSLVLYPLLSSLESTLYIHGLETARSLLKDCTAFGDTSFLSFSLVSRVLLSLSSFFLLAVFSGSSSQKSGRFFKSFRCPA